MAKTPTTEAHTDDAVALLKQGIERLKGAPACRSRSGRRCVRFARTSTS
jgi:hypothetical protein